MRFIWNVPLKFKRKFVRAIDPHLSDRYPMFKGLSEDWPAGRTSSRRTSVRAEERAHDFGLVTQGYLGYMNVGYTRARRRPVRVAGSAARQAVRGAALRDRPEDAEARREPKGGCPVKIHIPEMLELMGTGRFREALKLIESCNPLPERHRPRLPAGTAVPGRVHA